MRSDESQDAGRLGYDRPRLHPSTVHELDRWLGQRSNASFTYAEVGETSGALPAGYFHIHREWDLGRGEARYVAARLALFDWRMLPDATWFRLHPKSSGQIAPGDALALNVRVLGLWWLSAVRVIAVEGRDVDERRAAITYGTLPGHHAQGEERFEVEWLPDDRVVYRLRSFSRWQKLLARLALPVARAAQRRFADQSGANLRSALGETVVL